ncbi:carbamoyl-phosphate synthase large chain domain protein [Mycobacterium xenopi 4042]|uniref:Carbamoyl-phosphate synthase large chain domain protein n=1 Tax=Mycobacterium xenopi 4042 TaxID=1299334 RepID=X7ZN27_MYCXE|nr:carbamoyl-phosphate synthase large chain domain protein [Mycobacterium xenopi 4042]
MTLTDREYQRMRDLAIAILREVGVDTAAATSSSRSTLVTAG